MTGKTIAPRSRLAAWAATTFGEAIQDIFRKDAKVIKELHRQLAKLQLTDKPMDGYAVEGLPKTEEGRGGGVSYTETFFEIVNAVGSCSPIDFLYLLVEKSLSKRLDPAKITGILSRSMRTYASLLRDSDFAASMRQEILKDKSFRDFRIITSRTQDSKFHTDVLVETNGKEYRIWLFHYTRRGLPHDIERITGERGTLPKGIHLLCPLKSEAAMDYFKTLESTEKRTSKLAATEQRIKGAREGTKKLQALRARKARLLEKLAALEAKKKAFPDGIGDEVDVREGWFLYPVHKVKHVLRMIEHINNGEQVPEEYETVCTLLNAPKLFLSNISSFQV